MGLSQIDFLAQPYVMDEQKHSPFFWNNECFFMQGASYLELIPKLDSAPCVIMELTKASLRDAIRKRMRWHALAVEGACVTLSLC